MVIVDVAPEISASGAEWIRDFGATPELDLPQSFLERAVKFNPLRDPAVLRRSLHYNLPETPAAQLTFKHDQRRRSDEAIRSPYPTCRSFPRNHAEAKLTIVARSFLSSLSSTRSAFNWLLSSCGSSKPSLPP